MLGRPRCNVTIDRSRAYLSRQRRSNFLFPENVSLYRRSLTSQTRQHRVILSGIQPTGVPHLGNYLGALRQWVDLQNQADPADELLYPIVDLHAITVQQDAAQLLKWRRESLAALLAIGLNPNRCALFYQSSVTCSNSFVFQF